MNSIQSILWPGALVYAYYTLLEYAPEHICLPHCTYMSHCISYVVYIQTSHNYTYPTKVNKLQHLFTIPTAKYVPATNIPLKCYINAICPNYLMCINGDVCQYICHIWTTGINHVTRSAVHRQCCWQWQWMMTVTMMMPRPDCIAYIDTWIGPTHMGLTLWTKSQQTAVTSLFVYHLHLDWQILWSVTGHSNLNLIPIWMYNSRIRTTSYDLRLLTVELVTYALNNLE